MRYFAPSLLVVLCSIVIAQTDQGEPAPQQMPLPPGWTEADMQAMIDAGTPGRMHQWLTDGAGQWDAKLTTWGFPGSEPVTSQGVYTVTPIMDGRYVESEIKSEMPGMGMYHGRGVAGYDNVAQQFVSTWIDNHSTGIMQGVGDLSDDGKVLKWQFSYHCPVTGKPSAMREVDTITGPNTRTMELFGIDPKTGKEFKMMTIEFTRR